MPRVIIGKIRLKLNYTRITLVSIDQDSQEPVVSPGGCMWVHEHPIQTLVHPCIIVVFIVIIDTWLLTHSQYMYTTTQQVCQYSHVLFL